MKKTSASKILTFPAKMYWAAAFVLVLIGCAGIRAASAQDNANAKLPTAAEVLDRYVTATGGRQTIRQARQSRLE